MDYQISEKQLLVHFQNTDFVLKTQAQIVKDFERSGFTFGNNLLTTVLNFQQLTEEVADTLATVMQTGETTTLQLLYQIDLPQEQFLALTTDSHFLMKAAQMIIRREAQKVYLRSIL